MGVGCLLSFLETSVYDRYRSGLRFRPNSMCLYMGRRRWVVGFSFVVSKIPLLVLVSECWRISKRWLVRLGRSVLFLDRSSSQVLLLRDSVI